MKVLIDIPEEEYESLKRVSPVYLNFAERGVRNGTPIPDNATNGDMINAVFTEYPTSYNKDTNTVGMLSWIKTIERGLVVREYTIFSWDWWNAPYKADKGVEE